MIILDTHVWLWWLMGDTRLKPLWRQCIETTDRVCVSAISCVEVAWLAESGRITLPNASDEWMENAITHSGLELIPITPNIAKRAAELTQHHRDPQDRLIIATALAYQATLISADSKFPLYAELSDYLLD